MKATYLMSCAVVALVGASVAYAGSPSADAAPANGADSAASAPGDGVQDVVVTAQRRTQSIQNVPMTLQALTSDTLTQFNVATFDDLLKYTPNVTFGSNGPGAGQIFMRGLSAGVVGNRPKRPRLYLSCGG